MNKLLPFILLPLCGAALAEDGGVPMMPDGSRDMYVGVALASSSAAAAGENRPTVLRPLLQVEWSNGIFVSASGVAGMNFSPLARVEYGPLLAASNARDPSDNRRLRGSHAIEGSWDAGGYFNYYLGDDARLTSRLFYDTSAHGLRGDLGVQKSWSSLAPHHTFSLSAGVSLAGASVMRERYEVLRAAGGPRDYTPSGGIAAFNAGANWNWALSSKWLLTSGASVARLGAEPAASPVVERRTFLNVYSGFAYRF
jgi:outer membrane scaffolding protein for murein synthesis (MipA/OmpV family)